MIQALLLPSALRRVGLGVQDVDAKHRTRPDQLANPVGAPLSRACRHRHFADNGPKLTAWALRDWCRFSESGTSYIDLGSPVAEPLGRVLRLSDAGRTALHPAIAIEQLDALFEAQVHVADWREEYDTYRLHSALDMLTPADFVDRWWTDQLQPT